MNPKDRIEQDETQARRLDSEAEGQAAKDRKLADQTRTIANAYRSRAQYIRSRVDG